jgi:serine/threonine protein kinase
VKELRCLPVDNSVQQRVRFISDPRCCPLLTRNWKLVREIEAWPAVNHPNITPFFGICFDFDRPGVPSLVVPYYRNGNILNYTKQNPNVNKLSLVCYSIV